jgi:hypothetical protein
MKTEKAYSFETSVNVYRTTWRRMAEGDFVLTDVAKFYLLDIIPVSAPFVSFVSHFSHFLLENSRISLQIIPLPHPSN